MIRIRRGAFDFNAHDLQAEPSTVAAHFDAHINAAAPRCGGLDGGGAGERIQARMPVNIIACSVDDYSNIVEEMNPRCST